MPESFRDSVESRLAEFGGVGGLLGFEKARRFLQQGTVKGAKEALASARSLSRAVAPLDAAIQIGQGVHLITQENGREGHAEAGERLTKKPLLYQIAKAGLTPEDSFSKYGAYKEAIDKKAFEKIFEEGPWAEWVKKENDKVKQEGR